MSELTRKEIEQRRERAVYSNTIRICDMALRTHDAEQRAEQAEVERDNLRETRQIEIRATEQWRGKAHEARQESARLRGALEGIEKRTRNRVPDPGPCVDCVWGIASDALQSAPPASKPVCDACDDYGEVYIDDKRMECPNCADPAPADRPEPFKVGDRARTVFHGNERECRLTSQHDQWDFRNRWYVDVLAEDGRPLGHTIRHERDLMPSTDPAPADRPQSDLIERMRAEISPPGLRDNIEYLLEEAVTEIERLRSIDSADRPEPATDDVIQAAEMAGLGHVNMNALIAFARELGLLDRPEPSEALETKEFEDGFRSGWHARGQSLSQPAPAVPESTKLEWENLRNYVLGYGGLIPTAEELDRLENALATHPADGDSPAVPDGYTHVATIQTPDPFDERDGIWLSWENRKEAEKLPPGTKLFAAAPTPTDDGGNK